MHMIRFEGFYLVEVYYSRMSIIPPEWKKNKRKVYRKIDIADRPHWRSNETQTVEHSTPTPSYPFEGTNH